MRVIQFLKWGVVFASVCFLAGSRTCDAFCVPNPSCPHHRQRGVILSSTKEKELSLRDVAQDQEEFVVDPIHHSLPATTSSYSSSSRRQWIWSGLAMGLLSSQVASAKSLSSDYMQGTAALGSDEQADPIPKEAYIKLPSGVVYADIRVGSGFESAQVGNRVNVQWVLRRSNGYFVDSSQVQGDVPFIFTVGDGKAIVGLDEAVRGMKAGGVRRMLIPLKYGYVLGLDDGKPGPLPAGFGPRQQMRRVQEVRKDVPGEYIFLEVQATRVR